MSTPCHDFFSVFILCTRATDPGHTHTNIIICLISFHILFTLLGSITQHFQYFDVITYFMNNVQHSILTVHQKHLCLVLITTPWWGWGKPMCTVFLFFQQMYSKLVFPKLQKDRKCNLLFRSYWNENVQLHARAYRKVGEHGREASVTLRTTIGDGTSFPETRCLSKPWWGCGKVGGQENTKTIKPSPRWLKRLNLRFNFVTKQRDFPNWHKDH